MSQATKLGNILWVIFGGGIVIFFEYFISGILLSLTIVGIPLAVEVFKIAQMSLVPFGQVAIHIGDSDLSLLMNILWFVLGGFWISLTHLTLMLLYGLTIIGIPFAKQHWKLAALSFAPFGKHLISEEDYDYYYV